MAQEWATDYWAVTQYGETLHTFPTELAAWNWLHGNTSSSLDWAVRNSGYDIVHVKDGKPVSSYRQDVLVPRIAKAVAGKISQEEAAELFEESVQDAFTKVYGFPQDLSVIGHSILSSFSREGKKLGWTEPSPNVVLVLTEYAWIPDIYRSKEDFENWIQVGEMLRSMGWPNAGTDSINPAVQVVYWSP